MALTKVLRGGLSTGVSDSSDATAITIDSSENVGIGDTSPDAKLDVHGNVVFGDGGGFDMNIALLWGMTLSVGKRETMGNVAINNYIAGDGKRFWIVGLEGLRHWPPLCKVVGHPEWMEDERFADPRSRAINAAELISLLDKEFAKKSLSEWVPIFDSEPDFFWAPVNLSLIHI